jgi:hypothetical protein
VQGSEGCGIAQAMWAPEDTHGLWDVWVGRGGAAAARWVRFLCNTHSDAAHLSLMRRLQPLNAHTEVTDCVALDCEMVGVGPGTCEEAAVGWSFPLVDWYKAHGVWCGTSKVARWRVLTQGETPCISSKAHMLGDCPGGVQSQLARVSVVNDSGNVLLDSMVAPTAPVTDYRTRWSGVREADLVGAPPFDAVRESVRQLLHGRVLVGHALENDLAVLNFGQPGTRAKPTRPPHRERERGRERERTEQVSHGPSTGTCWEGGGRWRCARWAAVDANVVTWNTIVQWAPENTPYHAQLPPGAVPGQRACPHDRSDCPSR